jgi:TonB-linked SusC/RagA family outer membrane protein
MKQMKQRIYVLLFLSFFAGMSLFAQEHKEKSELLLLDVKGKVIDLSTRQGFAGVRISVVNTKLTAMSDENGAFVIRVPNPDVTFTVEAPGYLPQTIGLRGRTQLEIGMLLQTGPAAFYDNTELSTVNSVSVSSFSPDILSTDEDLTHRLSGQVRAIRHSGTSASGSAVFAKGFNSLYASSQPLYVVDGVVWQVHEGNGSIHGGFFNNPLAVIDPADVEKITVLKSGASIYGSKGANGVILIDTKRSYSPATDISVNIGVGYRAPFRTISVMDAETYRLYASDIIGSQFENPATVEKYKFLDDNPNKSYYKANHNNTDWLDLTNVGAWSQNYGINVRGGDDIALYAVSVGYTQSEGNVKNTGFDRLNFRANSDIAMTKAFKTAFDIAFTQTSNNVRNDGIDDISAPVYLSLIKSPLYNPKQFDLAGNLSNRLSNYDELGIGNPLALIESGIGVSKQYALNTAIRPTYTFGEDKVKLGLLFSYGWRKWNENAFIPDIGIPEYPLLNELGEIYAVASNRVADRMDTHTSMIVGGEIDWNILRNESQQLDVSGGYRFYSDIYKSHNAYGYNTGSDNMTQLSNATGNLRFSNGIYDSWRSISEYIHIDYAWKNRYLLNLSAAMDASSRFGNKAEGALALGSVAWGFFPSASAAWVISSEKFMKDLTFIDFLKLTAAYSLSGNDDLPNYASRTYFSSLNYWGSGTGIAANGIILDNIGNPTLKWETTGIASAALNFSLFNNRWNMKAELYSAHTKDLLTQKQLKDIAGIQTYWNNDGELKNRGYDIATQIRVLNNRQLKIDFGASIGHYKNEITSLANGAFVTDVSGAQILTGEGLPAGVFYGYKTAGVLSTKEDAAAANLHIRTASGQLIPFEAGDMLFEEVEKNDIIDENDRQVIGDPNPDFYGNFNFSVSWKKFTLEALFSYTYGNDVYNALRASLESGKDVNNPSTAMQNRWVANGQQTDIPRAVYGDPMGNARFSDRWIEDGSFLRFQSLSLTYKLPLPWTFLHEVSIWGSVSNIFTWTNYLGSDPEFAYGNSVLYQGIDAGLIPPSRSFNLGVKINL